MSFPRGTDIQVYPTSAFRVSLCVSLDNVRIKFTIKAQNKGAG